MEFKKILVRSLSGIIYIAIIVGCILLRSEGIAALTVLFGILATIEFTKITRYSIIMVCLCCWQT